MAKNWYINEDAKKIVIDMKNASKEEKELAMMNAEVKGYEVVAKREGKKGEKLTYDMMRTMLASDKASLEYLEKLIKAKQNYFKIKKWYKDQLTVIASKERAHAQA